MTNSDSDDDRKIDAAIQGNHPEVARALTNMRRAHNFGSTRSQDAVFNEQRWSKVDSSCQRMRQSLERFQASKSELIEATKKSSNGNDSDERSSNGDDSDDDDSDAGSETSSDSGGVGESVENQ